MKATGYIVSERYGTEMRDPVIFKTIEEANNCVQHSIADDMREDFFDELEEAGINTEDDEAVLDYGMEHEYCNTDYYMGRPDWHEFRIDKVTLDLEEDLTVEKAADTKLYVVEGDYDTDLEGMIFAVCTTKELAEKARSLLFDGEDLRITEMIADSIRTDNKILNVKDMQEDSEEIEME